MRIHRLVVLLVLLVAALTSAARAAPAYPLRVGPDGRRILDSEGNPIFFNTEAAWNIITRLTREDVERYLDNRQAKGFNAIIVMLIVAQGYHGTSNNVYGEPPFLRSGDFTTPNEAYFAHADWVLQQAQARGMTVFLAPAYLGYECRKPPDNQGWCRFMKKSGVAKMRRWGRWVGSRYRHQPNLIWLNGGDANAKSYGVLEEVDAVAEGIRAVDAHHLHTAHCDRTHSAADCYDRPWLDFNTTYAQCTRTPSLLAKDYARSPVRPVVFIEGRYEGESDWTETCIRSQAYWSLLSGAAGHAFGNGKIWGFLDGWQAAMESPGSRSMQHFVDLVRSRRWDLLVPDDAHTVLTAGYGDLTSALYARAARTSDGSTVIVYTPTQRTLTLDMGQLSGETAAGSWHDPSSGAVQRIGVFPTAGTQEFVPPSNRDWILVLERETGAVPGVPRKDKGHSASSRPR